MKCRSVIVILSGMGKDLKSLTISCQNSLKIHEWKVNKITCVYLELIIHLFRLVHIMS